MSAARSARRLLSRCPSSQLAVPTAPCLHYHPFHSSAPRPSRRRPRFKNISAEQLGLTTPEKIERFTADNFPAYTEDEKKTLAARYSPEQIAAIEAGESAIDPRDMAVQGRIRSDPYKPPYIEDYAVVQPVIDWRARPKLTRPTSHVTLPKSQDEWMEDYLDRLTKFAGDKVESGVYKAYARALRKVKESNPMVDLTEEELDDIENDPEARKKYIIEDGADEKSSGAGEAPPAKELSVAEKAKAAEMQRLFEEIERKFAEEVTRMDANDELEPTRLDFWKFLEPSPGGTVLSPDLGKVPGVAGMHKTARDPDDEAVDDAGDFTQTARVTGMKVRDMQGMLTKTLVTRWVANQTRLGKVRSSSFVTVAGNGDGWLGIGVAKSTEARVAELTSRLLAIKNMKPVRRYENRTIFGNVTAKVSGTVVELRSRPPGFGLRVSHRIFEMCRMAGIHDLSARIPRSRNPFNTVHACYKALTNQPDPEEIAIGRGKKMVDVRKVYYGGAVY